MVVAEIVVSGLAIYLGCGLLFALAFVTRGVERIDATARGTSFNFRLLLVPGAATLWPLLAVHWRRSRAETGNLSKQETA